MYDVLVLSHSEDSVGPQSGFLINHMARLFTESGLAVGFQKGLSRSPRARTIINQVDLTVTPRPYIRLLERYPAAINGGLLDISKRLVCRGHLVTPGDGYRGPVIVKTGLNYGGKPEQRLRRRRGILGRTVARLFSSHVPTVLEPEQYLIHSTPDLVPAEVWTDPDLVVQRFYEDRDENGLYRNRHWYVFGDRSFHVMVASREPVIKGSNIVDRQFLEVSTPPELETLRKDMGVDFGRFDYIMANGTAIVLDVNRTPSINPRICALYGDQLRDLAQGIHTYLER